ncbi:hypothetical protein S140_62 [Shewanella sp. phage 1/40]|uniref:hypothetical protein n=1 Tax=Shewanella sp. phage 1/40 TaxID=1458860 RepID=UPI0004F78A9D|nr:hypothetical protein S140_62 [Shewanella sp. phage 1/40]AHK11472.1 hypothetical protein S140_62 [Shewanella sp. phage 1/40]
MKFKDLKPFFQRFSLGAYETEYRSKGSIILSVYSDGTCDIAAGVGTNNLHFLQDKDLHRGDYQVPYFAYKANTRFESVDVAEVLFNKWLENNKEDNNAK